ncbi:hypothetical protein NDU88_002121 [Pleurodeles waltl]|uniref:Uncharacterized protein n=1 Tax=Pleurodeles waltl TaxID=8319 RepID=A0AAV7MMF3_PLEWA|nr:hypothetical protein NDU88_002121 [Pleurodeles waltl]
MEYRLAAGGARGALKGRSRGLVGDLNPVCPLLVEWGLFFSPETVDRFPQNKRERNNRKGSVDGRYLNSAATTRKKCFVTVVRRDQPPH